MSSRMIRVTYMLPSEFPNVEVDDIYCVLTGNIRNHIVSRENFKYPVFMYFQDPKREREIGKRFIFRCDDLSWPQFNKLLSVLSEDNNAPVDYSLALRQGEKLHHSLRGILGDTQETLRFTTKGKIYLSD